MQAWSFLSVSGERSWQSNDGYDDELGEVYRYDSAVGNHKQVNVGDVVVLWDSDLVLGVSRIERIDSESSTKLRSRCPKCDRTGIEYRKLAGEFTCTHPRCRARFAEPVKKLEPVTAYHAMYASRWTALDGAVPRDAFDALLVGGPQSSIRKCDLPGLTQLLATKCAAIPADPLSTSATSITGGFRAAQVRARIGQDEFRVELLQKYGLACAITGACPAEVIEAAHIIRYADHGMHDVANGLLLRADIHRLFDRNLLTINPTARTVEISPNLSAHPIYSKLMGLPLTQHPSTDSLAHHYELTRREW